MATGLHGHRIGAALERSAAAELIGTFILVLAIITTAVSAALATPIAGPAFSSATVPRWPRSARSAAPTSTRR
ncbi:hypothetical protein ACQP2X_21270 [Actinoplanes sp. CA-131856]